MFPYGYSPLRYPGGKGLLSDFLTDLIKLNNLQGGVYYELYAGGAGAALKLLFDGVVRKIVINDADYRIYCFWYSVLYDTKRFIALLEQSNVNIEEWQRQKEIYQNAQHESVLDVGFATFFLNRTNRSGILHKAGPIGGKNQDGNYLIGARFNKCDLKNRILFIADKVSSIELHNDTTESFLENLRIHGNSKIFFYLDPPYYHKGKELYLNNYNHSQHLYLSSLLEKSKIKYWLVSYDNADAIRGMYKQFRKATFNFNYSLQEKKQATELLIFSDNLIMPRNLIIRKNKLKLAIAK
jgi:DNA adenine methylase